MRRGLIILGLCVLAGTAIVVSPKTPNKAAAATQITISAPSNGQTFSGHSFDISGKTDANSTVVLLKDSTVLKQTISDSSGNWTANITNLPDGNVTITAKVIKNQGYAYFTSTPDQLDTFHINRIRLSDNAINPGGGGWPVTSSQKIITLAPNNNSSVFYTQPGYLDTAALPASFDVNAPADPVPVTGGYPSNPIANIISFSPDGVYGYVANIGNNKLSIINTSTNAFVSNVTLLKNGIGSFRATNGKIYVTENEQVMEVIDPSTNLPIKNYTNPCQVVTLNFSPDPTYPYYYGFCINDGKIIQYKTSDDSINATWNVGGNPTGGHLNLDNSKLYYFISSFSGAPNADKIYVLNVTTGTVDHTIQLQTGSVGFMPSPDWQKLYVATEGNGPVFTTNNIDIIDVKTESITHLPTPDSPVAVTYPPGLTSQVAIANVGVVLGVSTGGTLANTGVTAISATILVSMILGSSLYVYLDYRRHKKPLVMEDPHVHYTLGHHLRQVTVPLFKYRLSVIIKTADNSKFSKF